MPALQIGYHDHCFDGVASAAAFLRFYRDKVKPGLTDVGLRGLAHRAGQLFDPDVFAGEENAVVDFRFSPDPRLTWWFDHHQSAFENARDEAVFRADRSGRKFWDPQAKSCTRFLARIVEEKFGWDPSPLRELIDWAEIIDGALFPTPQMAVALSDPPMQLMLLIEASKDPELLPRLIRELSQRPLSAVLREPWVTGPLRPLLERPRRPRHRQREQVHRLRGGRLDALHRIRLARSEPEQDLARIQSLETAVAPAQPGADRGALWRRRSPGGGGDLASTRPAPGSARCSRHHRRRAPTGNGLKARQIKRRARRARRDGNVISILFFFGAGPSGRLADLAATHHPHQKTRRARRARRLM
jgi:hypothetical protein